VQLVLVVVQRLFIRVRHRVVVVGRTGVLLRLAHHGGHGHGKARSEG